MTVTDEQLRQVEAVAPKYTDAMIAKVIFLCSPSEFWKLKGTNPLLVDAIESAREAAQMKLSDVLYSQALAGNVEAIRYLERTRYGVTEASP